MILGSMILKCILLKIKADLVMTSTLLAVRPIRAEKFAALMFGINIHP